RELNIVPLVGGDSDVGIGVGQISDVAGLVPGPQLYRWRLESGTFITFKLRGEEMDHLVVPFQDYYLLWTQPRLGTGGRVRVDVRASFTDETTLKFYGVGNATPRPPPTVSDADREYGRIHPTLAVETRVQLRRAIYLQLG